MLRDTQTVTLSAATATVAITATATVTVTAAATALSKAPASRAMAATTTTHAAAALATVVAANRAVSAASDYAAFTLSAISLTTTSVALATAALATPALAATAPAAAALTAAALATASNAASPNDQYINAAARIVRREDTISRYVFNLPWQPMRDPFDDIRGARSNVRWECVDHLWSAGRSCFLHRRLQEPMCASRLRRLVMHSWQGWTGAY